MPNDEIPATITVRCDECGQLHVGDYSHDDRYNGRPLYGVICTAPSNPEQLTDYYNDTRNEA